MALSFAPLAKEPAARERAGLIELLRDAVDGGASLGFHLPLHDDEAKAFWAECLTEYQQGHRDIFIAINNGIIVGAIQVSYPSRSNAHHRADIEKLMVHSRMRRQGIASHLVRAVEAAAHKAGKSLLTLDTRSGDDAERLYRNLGYESVGVIPGFTRDHEGLPHDTTFFFREI